MNTLKRWVSVVITATLGLLPCPVAAAGASASPPSTSPMILTVSAPSAGAPSPQREAAKTTSPFETAELGVELTSLDGGAPFNFDATIRATGTSTIPLMGIPFSGPATLTAEMVEASGAIWRSCVRVTVDLRPDTLTAVSVPLCQVHDASGEVSAWGWQPTLELGDDASDLVRAMHQAAAEGAITGCDRGSPTTSATLEVIGEGSNLTLLWPDEAVFELLGGERCTFGIEVSDTGVLRLTGEAIFVASAEQAAFELPLWVVDPITRVSLSPQAEAVGLLADVSDLTPYLDGGGWPAPLRFQLEVLGAPQSFELSREGALLTGSVEPGATSTLALLHVADAAGPIAEGTFRWEPQRYPELIFPLILLGGDRSPPLTARKLPATAAWRRWPDSARPDERDARRPRP